MKYIFIILIGLSLTACGSNSRYPTNSERLNAFYEKCTANPIGDAKINRRLCAEGRANLAKSLNDLDYQSRSAPKKSVTRCSTSYGPGFDGKKHFTTYCY